ARKSPFSKRSAPSTRARRRRLCGLENCAYGHLKNRRFSFTVLCRSGAVKNADGRCSAVSASGRRRTHLGIRRFERETLGARRSPPWTEDLDGDRRTRGHRGRYLGAKGKR